MSGWIKLHRKLTEWEWYSDVNTTRVFLHLLLVANHKDNQWRGIPIKRGQRLTSLSGLAKETNLSIKNIRTAIKRLKATHEVASHSTAQHTVITVLNYDLYQSEASETASEGQANGKQRATNKNENNEKNKDNIDWDDLKNYFNSLMPNKKVASISDKRKKHIRSMLKSTGRDIDTLKASIEYAATTENGYWPSHRNGNTDHTGKFWPPKDFDFYMREATFLKTIED